MATTRRKRASAPAAPPAAPPTEMVAIADLRPHPKNYRNHPEEQVRHIAASIRQHGFYRNVVVARDGTILAGHGVVLAARTSKLTHVPVIRVALEHDDPRALKILASDNELGRFAEDDDRKLTELLREIKELDEESLLGTGYDEKQLAALVMVTRPASEIADIDEAAEWVGMPEYHEKDGERFQLVVTFESEAERQRFVREKDITVIKTVGATWSARWPAVEKEDASSLRFRDEDDDRELADEDEDLEEARA